MSPCNLPSSPFWQVALMPLANAVFGEDVGLGVAMGAEVPVVGMQQHRVRVAHSRSHARHDRELRGC